MIPAAGISTPAALAEAAPALNDVVHELRQPLSAIESIAYYLTLVLPRDDPKVQAQLARLQHLVEQSDWILSNSVRLAQPIAAAPSLLAIDELITGIVSSRPWPPDRTPHLELAENLPPAHLDVALGRALLTNLVTLFRQLPDTQRLTIRTLAAGDHTAVEFETPASGFRSETALGPGGNLSLASARRIVAAHGGAFECHVDPNTGIRVRVVLP